MNANPAPLFADPSAQPAQRLCNARLILPRDKAIWHPSGRCQSPALPGKCRCARQGGSSTGARTPEGMAAVAKRMHEGRRRWIAQTKAEGKPLPFAGFRPKGSGTPRAVRQAAITMRATVRESYAAAKRAAESLKTTVKALRLAAPDRSPVELAASPEGQRQAAETILALQPVLAATAPAQGPFAEAVSRQRTAALRAALPSLKAVLASEFEAAVLAEKHLRDAPRRARAEYWRQVAWSGALHPSNRGKPVSR